MSGKTSVFIRYFILAALWAGLIFYFSSIPDLGIKTISMVPSVILRKLAHIGEYMVLVCLVFWLIHSIGKNFKKSAFFAVIIVSIYSLSDELHQAFVVGRDGRLLDSAIDILGAILGIQLLGFFYGQKLDRKKIIYLGLNIILLVTVGMKFVGEAIVREKIIQTEYRMRAYYPTKVTENELPPINSLESSVEENNNPEENDVSPKETITDKLPEKVLLKVPFTSQAPHASWDEYHEEACEEASLIMFKYFLDIKEGKIEYLSTIPKDVAEEEIQRLIKYQLKTKEDYKDTTAKETVDLGRAAYGISNLKVVYDFSEQDLKKYLAKGNPIIIPAAGRMLGNPNFTAPGPLYHNLVLIGYDGDTIITNDPGTRKGAGYRYNIKTIFNAIHDFPGDKEEIEKGRKAMIVIE